MPTDDQVHLALSDPAARQLANATKTTAQLDTITPRWLTRLLQWVPVEAGIYRLNRVKHPESVEIACPPRDESELPQTHVGYEESPREYFLSSVLTVVDIHTRISDLYSSPYDQIGEQLRLTIETIKERQESELINNPDYGMLANIADGQRVSTITGPPTPDDLDELITKVWKEPAFFLTHPGAVAAFGRECTRRGVPRPRSACSGRSSSPGAVCRSSRPTRCRSPTGRPRCCCCASGSSGRASSACSSRAWPVSGGRGVGAVHGHQPQRHRLVPGLVVLLARGAHP